MTITLASVAAFLAGLSKGGIKGFGILIVTLMVLAYGAKPSVGILVPVFILGDILAVWHFQKHVQMKHIVKFLPTMAIGVVLAVLIGNQWTEEQFQKGVALIIIVAVVITFLNQFSLAKPTQPNKLFAYSMGLIAGITTMIGNLAGPFAHLYFLNTGLNKNTMIATGAWIFFIINLFKVPFHVFAWKTINIHTLTINLWLAPTVIFGFFIGTRLIHLFSENQYRYFLLIVTALGAIILLFQSL